MEPVIRALPWSVARRPEELLLALLASLLVLFLIWCAVTWLLAYVSMNLAIAIAPPILRAALIAGLVVTISPTAQAQDATVDSISGLALPERPAGDKTANSRPSGDQTPPAQHPEATELKTPADPGPHVERPATVDPDTDTPPLPKATEKDSSSRENPFTTEQNRASSTTSDDLTAPNPDQYYVVKSGDNLWQIAAKHLNDDSPHGEIAHAVKRWIHVNHHVIGNNPDLIHPGQQLKEPQA